MLEFASDWQELIGAFLGGAFALAVAILVANDARLREDRTAATLLIGVFTMMAARHGTLAALQKEHNISAEERPYWLAEKLTQSRPRLSPFAEAALARLLTVHPLLAVHLELFRNVHAELDLHVDRLVKDDDEVHKDGKASRSDAAMAADSKNAASTFDRAARHGECAYHLLQLLVLSKVPTWHRIRLRLFPTKADLACVPLT